MTAAPDLARRITLLMLLRTILVSLLLGLALWVSWAKQVDPWSTPSALLLAVVGATYALTIVYALLLRGGIAPERLVWPQIGGDLAITAVLVAVTGGAQSAYTFFFALSIVGAAMMRSKRTTVMVTLASTGLMAVIALLVWKQLLPLPVTPLVAPHQPAEEFARSLALNLGALLGVGGLAYLLAGELQHTEASLATQRRVVADLITLHQDIVRSLTSGLVTVDLDGRVLTINDSAAELLGAREGIGQDVETLLPGLRTRVDDLAPGGEVRRADLAVTIDGRPLALGISVSPLRDVRDQVVGRVINFTDLTELRRMEHRIKHAERMATIGQLAAGIAHEIRNPLASMSGSIELLQQGADVSEDDRTLMTIVVREIDRLNALINDLLDYASPRPREPVSFDLPTLVDETLQVFRQDKSRAEVDVQAILPPPGTLAITADPAKLRQVIWNLVRNAADAAAAGGGHVAIAVTDGDAVVELAVTDDGPGIPTDHLPRIFDPYFTTKKTGTGLGLAMCHSIVAEHGGTIEATSEVGKGTRFVVTLSRGQ